MENSRICLRVTSFANGPLTFHEHFLNSKYEEVMQFVSRFNHWSQLETNLQYIHTGLTENQSVNMNLVWYYLGKSNEDPLMNQLISDLCLENAYLEFENAQFSQNLQNSIDLNKSLKTKLQNENSKLKNLSMQTQESVNLSSQTMGL